MKQTTLLLLILLGSWLAYPAPSHAHGGGSPQLSNALVGSYGVSAWTSPAILRTGTVHLTVAVAEPPAADSLELGSPILDAQVQVQVTPPDGIQPIVRQTVAPAQASHKFFYETDFVLEDAGIYRVDLQIAGKYGTAQTTFDMEVRSGQAKWWLVLFFVGWVVALSIWQWKRASKQVAPARTRQTTQHRTDFTPNPKGLTPLTTQCTDLKPLGFNQMGSK